jgi:surface protein
MQLTNGWTMTSGLTFTSSATPPSGGNLVMTFNTQTANTVYLPLGGDGGSVNAVIDWGDGNTALATTANVYSHTYAAIGNYQVTITGTMSGYGYSFSGSENNPLRSVDSWDNDLGITSLQFAFKGATNLTQVPNTLPSTVQLINYMFSGATSLYSLDLSGWNTSNVTGWDGVFSGATTFNGNISTWNTSQATSMTTFFYNCYYFNGNISSWNVANVNSMNNMFENAERFNQNIGNWDVANVNAMNGMFSFAGAFNQNLSSWTTGLIGQPDNFSTGANAVFANNASNLKPFLSDGTTRIDT